jgi:hypothetical protein
MISAMRTIRLTAVLSIALTMGLVMMDAAHASSIVYTKGGDVWRSSPDGRDKARLTRDGGYSSPSQDDRGRVYAVQRGRFVRLTRGGKHIGASFSAAVGRSGNVTAFGPWEAQVSPDGRRIAYWRGVQRLEAPIGGYAPYDLEDQVVVSRSDRFTPDSVFGYQRSYRDPTWIGNRELLVFNYGLLVEQAALFAPKAAGGPTFGQWFSDPDVAQIGDGEVSRDGHLLAAGAGGGIDANNIAIYRLAANTPPDAPERVCAYHSNDGSTTYADPTFSPDRQALAYAQDAPGKRADGVYVWSLKRGCTGSGRLIARGAKEPDWGPARPR